MANLYIICGLPGAGKSTWLRSNSKGGWTVSRDEIRFSLLEDGEDYFAKEPLVWKTFIKHIQDSLSDGEGADVYVDASHLTPQSRNKLFSAIGDEYLKDVKCIALAFVADLKTCLERNALRSGRAKVPENVILRMAASYSIPDPLDEKHFDEVRIIKL